MDPRNVVAFWDNIRYRIRASRPTWILDRRKLCDGVPELSLLQQAIDEKLPDTGSK